MVDYKKDIYLIVRLDIIDTCFWLFIGETLQEPTVYLILFYVQRVQH